MRFETSAARLLAATGALVALVPQVSAYGYESDLDFEYLGRREADFDYDLDLDLQEFARREEEDADLFHYIRSLDDGEDLEFALQARDEELARRYDDLMYESSLLRRAGALAKAASAVKGVFHDSKKDVLKPNNHPGFNQPGIMAKVNAVGTLPGGGREGVTGPGEFITKMLGGKAQSDVTKQNIQAHVNAIKNEGNRQRPSAQYNAMFGPGSAKNWE